MIPHMLKLAKKQSFPEDFPKPRKFRETSRNDWIFKFRVQNQVSWQKVSGKNTQYIEISQNQPNLGHFVVLGFWDSKVQKIKEVTKSTQNYPIYVTGIISAKNYQKTTLFPIIAILLCKSSNEKKTMLMLWIFLTKKLCLAERESFKSEKVFKVKVVSISWFDTILTLLNALWWILKKGHHGIFDFILLVSSVLVTDSKN